MNVSVEQEVRLAIRRLVAEEVEKNIPKNFSSIIKKEMEFSVQKEKIKEIAVDEIGNYISSHNIIESIVKDNISKYKKEIERFILDMAKNDTEFIGIIEDQIKEYILQFDDNCVLDEMIESTLSDYKFKIVPKQKGKKG